MWAFVIGGVSGGLELLLLKTLIHHVQRGETGRVALIALLKLMLMAGAFVPVILYMRGDLLWCGVGMSAALIVGAFIRSLIAQSKAKRSKGCAQP